MNAIRRHHTARKLLAAALAAAMVLATEPLAAWWGGPWGPYTGGWDPQEAFLNQYGFLDPFGPTPGDIRRLRRDQWKAWRGYPVFIDEVGPYGPSLGAVIRQQRRKAHRLWGYPY
jgi:hypothetical protein